MKLLFNIALVMMVISVSKNAMATDTIYVNSDQHAYLVFDEEVSLLDLGGEREYGMEIPENVVLVRGFAARAEKNAVYLTARSDTATETSIFVQAGKKAYVGVVCFRDVTTKLLYDQRDRTLNKAASYDRENYVPEVDISLIEERLYQLDQQKREILDVGVSNNKVDWSLTNLRVDNSAIYLKLRLENQSALVYRIESISVENAEFYRKRLLSKKKVNKVPVEPLVEGSIVDVRPYDQHDYYLAIPVYAVGDQGAVMVTIRETSGIRSLQLEIPPQLMANANLF
ncbi:DUF4138 domain-containing protein [Tunicatimonas pelagia]|uniref:DUF4138 domain-containing protein n=1 Tax=Tunicatimonas pelagia TaxID=931531 RepID=UPI0026660931|nr:DUF4138 domain-containing protein [Tunicatimonas pelagia]WKN46479.1 DUF4138 domain-containing protein [Tunicatimonas pelagia]